MANERRPPRATTLTPLVQRPAPSVQRPMPSALSSGLPRRELTAARRDRPSQALSAAASKWPVERRATHTPPAVRRASPSPGPAPVEGRPILSRNPSALPKRRPAIGPGPQRHQLSLARALAVPLSPSLPFLASAPSAQLCLSQPPRFVVPQVRSKRTHAGSFTASFPTPVSQGGARVYRPLNAVELGNSCTALLARTLL